MKVYVLAYQYWDTTEILAVYLSEESAQRAREEKPVPSEYYIEAFEVQP